MKTKCWLNVAKRNTFGDQAHDIFNDLPKSIRVIKDRKVFIEETKRYYRDKTLARSLSLLYQIKSDDILILIA